ncbi:MAG: magnesium transporter [Candidatus Hadarchaeales archaeon]
MPSTRETRGMFVQGFIVLAACVFLELGAGAFLKTMEDTLRAVGGLAIMTLPLLDLRGNINGAFASRLGSALHLGVIPPRLGLTRDLRVNIISSLLLTFMASATIGVLSWATGVLTGVEVDVLRILVISILAGMASGFILAFMTIGVAVYSYLKGVDPDNITAPLMATVGDFVTVLCIYLAVILVG